MHDDDDQDDGVTDAELVQEFTDFYDRTGQYARTSLHLTAEEKRRALKITTGDLVIAFDLDAARVRQVQRVRRKNLSTPPQKGEKLPEDNLRSIVPQQISSGSETPSSPRGTRIVGVAPGPQEGVPEAQIRLARAS